VKFSFDHILKFAAIYLHKVAEFDILQALVAAKQEAPPELVPILDKIAVMLNTVNNDSVDQIDEFANAVAGVGAKYRDYPGVIYFLNGVLEILNGYLGMDYEPTPEEKEEIEAENPFVQLQEEQEHKENTQMSGWRSRKQDWMTEYQQNYKPRRRQRYALIKASDPVAYQALLDSNNERKRKHRENLSEEERLARFKAHNETTRNTWRANLSPEEKARQFSAHNETHRKKFREDPEKRARENAANKERRRLKRLQELKKIQESK